MVYLIVIKLSVPHKSKNYMLKNLMLNQPPPKNKLARTLCSSPAVTLPLSFTASLCLDTFYLSGFLGILGLWPCTLRCDGVLHWYSSEKWPGVHVRNTVVLHKVLGWAVRVRYSAVLRMSIASRPFG